MIRTYVHVPCTRHVTDGDNHVDAVIADRDLIDNHVGRSRTLKARIVMWQDRQWSDRSIVTRRCHNIVTVFSNNYYLCACAIYTVITISIKALVSVRFRKKLFYGITENFNETNTVLLLILTSVSTLIK